MATDEVMEDVPGTKRPALDIESLKRKKFKADDLPLSAAQHAAIDKLLHSFRKKGGFDNMRKQIWAEFNDGEFKTNFTDQLIALAESEIEREPAHLSRERGKAATLIEGAVDRGDVYKNVEKSLDQLASKHLESILCDIRAIRRQEIGEEAAAKEEEAGSKTDEAYETEVNAKREERDKVYREEMRKQKEIEEEQDRTRAEEKRKKRELERQKEDEDRARRKEIDDQRRAERERLREEQRALDDQRERERQERYERRRREDRDRYRDYDRDRSRTRDRDHYRDRSPAYRSDRGLSPRSRDPKREKFSTSKDPTPAPPVDEKSLEEAALQMLLKEGEELAAKARQKREFDFEEAEAIENGLKPATSTQTRSANDPKLPNISNRGASLSRDSRRRDSIADRDRTRQTRERSRSRSRSRRRQASRYDPNRRRDRSRDTSMKEVTDLHVAAVADLLEEGIERAIGSEIVHALGRETETSTGAALIAAATEVETAAMHIALAAYLSLVVARARNPAPVRVFGTARAHAQSQLFLDNARVLDLLYGEDHDLGGVPARDDHRGKDAGLLALALATLIATFHQTATAALHLDAESDLQSVMLDLAGLWTIPLVKSTQIQISIPIRLNVKVLIVIGSGSTQKVEIASSRLDFFS
ncbi:Elongation factor Tu [Penicillium atrosanguineum]|uniref:Elongation factor Tu n=1 Tax=Penicillium atrosanguineum TaxID=1132637 RepID=UPI0023962006|nr:Elongation factor Tu [Penicillium atrosanguineum]KAJ5314210.1 Elongation factor Tu [Penicillium atrosanguineum]